jgi:hypothetical protein
LSKAAQSLFVFGLYALLAGSAFLIAPDLVVSLAHLPPIPTGWARVIGLIALVIGTYDIVCARAECSAFFKASVFTRMGFAIASVLLVVLGQMPMPMMLLGAVDAAGALWTAIALKQDRATSSVLVY